MCLYNIIDFILQILEQIDYIFIDNCIIFHQGRAPSIIYRLLSRAGVRIPKRYKCTQSWTYRESPPIQKLLKAQNSPNIQMSSAIILSFFAFSLTFPPSFVFTIAAVRQTGIVCEIQQHLKN